MDNHGNILVVDGNHLVWMFTADGEFVKAVGREGRNPLEFKRPTGIAIHPQSAKMYVSDTENHRIQILNPDLSFNHEFGNDVDGCCLEYPWGLAFDSTRNLYVTDGANHFVKVYTAEGEFLRKFGGEGVRNGEFNYPTCVSIDCDDTVYVSEYSNHRVSVFSWDGRFLSSFGSLGCGRDSLMNLVE